MNEVHERHRDEERAIVQQVSYGWLMRPPPQKIEETFEGIIRQVLKNTA